VTFIFPPAIPSLLMPGIYTLPELPAFRVVNRKRSCGRFLKTPGSVEVVKSGILRVDCGVITGER
jgi:hypothetical protein